MSRHGIKCKTCNPIGAHSGFEDLFDNYVYCQYDKERCDRSPYLEWSRYCESFKSDEEAILGMDYCKWMREVKGVKIKEAGYGND